MLKTVSSITNAIGALNYKGTWNASTNTPILASGVGTKGDYYVVSVAGTTTLDGISNWGVGDWAAFNGTAWQRVEGGTDVNAVNVTFTGSASGPSFETSNLSAGATLANNALTADGTDVNIDLNITPKGAGKTTLGGIANNPTSYLERNGLAAYEDYQVVRFSTPAASNIFSTFSGLVSVQFAADRASSVNECSIRAVDAFITVGAYQEGSSSVNLRANVTVLGSHRLEFGTGSQGTLDVALVCEGSNDNGATWTTLTSSTGIDFATGTLLLRIRANLTGTLPFQFSRIRSSSSISGTMTGSLSVVSCTITPI